ncbi:ATP-binding protein [Pelagibacterium limicola]|uniref:sensor histidine kinase n=1 Tax=Pelagibacterium limicola TaxID=2791022 RepID=UPI0018AF8D37
MIVSWGGSYATRFYFSEAEARGQNTLRLAVAVLRGHLARFERLPQLLADHEDIRRLVSNPGDDEFVEEMNLWLKSINALLESSDLYVMLPNGDTLAASNFDTDTSFVGGNFAYRPYFLDPMEGRPGRFFALGTTSLKRGYYFGAPVIIGGDVAGVVVIKIDIDAIEDNWRGGDYEIFVTDPEGVIFMTSKTDWLFMSVPPLTGDLLERTAETRRYADAQLRDLPTSRGAYADHELLLVEDGGTFREFLMLTEEMAEAGWTVKVLLDTTPARAQALSAVILAVLVVGLITLSAAIYLQRRARLRERRQLERAAQEQLERRVAERTAELAAVNTKLEEEIGERKATEAVLRKTQSDLIQAGKLAALGQMSAALSHEFNQPLSAARNYADNALVLIERGRIEDARGNVTRISGLIDRMASISRHLRNFARKPNQRLSAIDLGEVVRDTLEIIDWRIKAGEAELTIDLGDVPVRVLAGPVRLEQVLVNILGNAIDAVSEGEDKRVELAARHTDDAVTITVRDHGPGIPTGLGGRIFDPFFSTKGVGKGLGLGLSISYNIIKDFGGELRAENHPEGGAVFTIVLKPAGQTSDTALEPAQ